MTSLCSSEGSWINMELPSRHFSSAPLTSQPRRSAVTHNFRAENSSTFWPKWSQQRSPAWSMGNSKAVSNYSKNSSHSERSSEIPNVLRHQLTWPGHLSIVSRHSPTSNREHHLASSPCSVFVYSILRHTLLQGKKSDKIKLPLGPNQTFQWRTEQPALTNQQ